MTWAFFKATILAFLKAQNISKRDHYKLILKKLLPVIKSYTGGT